MTQARFILGRDPQGQVVKPLRSHLRHHAVVLGNTGAAKTMLALSILLQALRHPEPDLKTVVVIDKKGDPVLEHAVRTNIPDGWEYANFTLTESRASHTFNALTHLTNRFKSASERTDVLCSRLGLVLGQSKEQFFVEVNRRLVLEAFATVERNHIDLTNWEQLLAILESARAADKDDFKHATDVLNRIRSLSACRRLGDIPSVPSLVVPEIFTRPTVLYVTLPAMEGTDLAAYATTFLIQEIMASANGTPCLVVCDEGHRIFNSKAMIEAAEQARGFGLGFVICAQAKDQFKTQDEKPLGYLVDHLARVKVEFSLNTSEELKEVMVFSGLKDVQRHTRTVSQRSGLDPNIAITTIEDKELNLDLNQLLDHSSNPMSFVLTIRQDPEYPRPTLVQGAWPLTLAEYQRYHDMPFPPPLEPALPPAPLPTPEPVAAQDKPPKKRGPKSDALKKLEESIKPKPKKPSSRRKKRDA